MRMIHRTTLVGSLAAALILALAGCSSDGKTKEHAKQVSAANEHWLKMRSGLMLGMAQQQFDTGDLDQADRTLNEAFRQDPKNPKIIVLIGRLSLERGQLERASQRFTEAIALDAKMPEAHYYLAIVLQRWQRYDPALEHYTKAFELEHDNLGYLLAMSEMMVTLDKADDALAMLTDKATYFDQSAALRVAIAQILMLKRDFPQAIKYFQQALVLKPDDRQAQESLVQAQLQGGQVEEGLHTLEKLCRDKKYANRLDLQRLLGNTYLTTGRPGDAKEVFLKLTQAEPGDADAWIRLGQAAFALRDTNGAFFAANRAMNLAPNSQDGYLLAGMVWQERGRLDDALRMFDRAAELAPKSADAVVLRGIALARAGRTTAAAEAYTEALRRRPDDVRVKTLLANVNATTAPEPQKQP